MQKHVPRCPRREDGREDTALTEAPSGPRTQTSFHFSCTNGQRARSFQSRGDGEAPRPSPRSSPSQTKVTHQQRHQPEAGSTLGRECCRASAAGTEVTVSRVWRVWQAWWQAGPNPDSGQTGSSNSPTAGWWAPSFIPQQRGHPWCSGQPWWRCPAEELAGLLVTLRGQSGSGPAQKGVCPGTGGWASRPWASARSRPPGDPQPLACSKQLCHSVSPRIQPAR